MMERKRSILEMFSLIKMKKMLNNIHTRIFRVWMISLSFCAVFLSCSDGIRVVTEFPLDKKLSGNNIEQLDSMFTAFSVTKVADKYVFGIKKDKNLFCVCDDGLNTLSKILRRGNGHNEYLAPRFTGQTVIMDGKEYACFLERERNILYALEVDSISLAPVELVDFNNVKLQGLSYIYKVDENQYVGSRLLDKSELVLYDAEMQKVTVLEPDGMDSKRFVAKPFDLSQTLATYNDKQRAMAVSYFTFPVISIISVEGTYNVTLQIGDKMPRYTSQSAIEPHFYCLDICSTDSYVYVLYDDMNRKEEMSILAFDWEGKPVARYHTPRLTCFTVDEKNKRFIALMEDDTDGLCYEFEYSE